MSAEQLTEANYDQLVPSGKEVDAIYGDHALGNTAARAVIAAPLASRNANMTVRTIAGCLIDLASRGFESDQLSAFYPGRRAFAFTKAESTADSVTVIAEGSDTRPECRVTYRFVENQPVLEVTSVWKNTTNQDWTLKLEDDLRADGGKEDMQKATTGTHDVFWFHDLFWQQAYGITAPGYSIRCNSGSRECVLTYEPADGKPVIMKPGASFTLTRMVLVAKNLPEVLATVDEVFHKVSTSPARITLNGANGPIADARLSIKQKNGDSRGTAVTNEQGQTSVRLPAGEYTINASVFGTDVLPKDAIVLAVKADADNTFALNSQYSAGTVSATITDGDGQPIPAKVEFIGSGDTTSPNWGPESAEHFVKNLAYTANGRFQKPLQAGTYDIIVSHGPEYDAVFTKLTVEPGKTAELNAALKHSVQTPGWVSSDFHSHSSPSGDNTGSQRGRVLNLVAENIEFAPCTEHNRVSTYDHHIAELGISQFMATVSGMELTGKPLPLNHQNVFPMKHTPRTQDGGGPITDDSPETQIERLSLWDDRSEKLIQQNHPDLGWLFYDKNGDGIPDEGYSRSFPLMDDGNYPIDAILNLTRFEIRGGKEMATAFGVQLVAVAESGIASTEL
ncbi:MAG: hypothetical protein R3C49_02295 [Planctomycetaceae bacterium]